MARKQPQKSLSQLNFERETRFYAALQKISEGTSRKQAILSSGMDPRTFNKLIASKEDSGELFLTSTDKKGHYRLSGSTTAYARWEVLKSDGTLSTEHVDYEMSLVLSRYWNTVRSDLQLGYGSGLDNFTPQYIYNIYGEKIELERSYVSVQRWHSKLNKSKRELFNEEVYRREYSNA